MLEQRRFHEWRRELVNHHVADLVEMQPPECLNQADVVRAHDRFMRREPQGNKRAQCRYRLGAACPHLRVAVGTIRDRFGNVLYCFLRRPLHSHTVDLKAVVPYVAYPEEMRTHDLALS